MLTEESVRINRFLSAAGVCSRREADRLIESGRVLVNGRPAEKGMKLLPKDVVVFDGKTLSKKEYYQNS